MRSHASAGMTVSQAPGPTVTSTSFHPPSSIVLIPLPGVRSVNVYKRPARVSSLMDPNRPRAQWDFSSLVNFPVVRESRTPIPSTPRHTLAVFFLLPLHSSHPWPSYLPGSPPFLPIQCHLLHPPNFSHCSIVALTCCSSYSFLHKRCEPAPHDLPQRLRGFILVCCNVLVTSQSDKARIYCHGRSCPGIGVKSPCMCCARRRLVAPSLCRPAVVTSSHAFTATASVSYALIVSLRQQFHSS